MKMSDGQNLFYAVIGFFIIVLLFVFGSIKSERDRIYEKCVERNSTMVHAEVTKMCKEFTK
jgi:hypothetical protein